MRFTTVFSLLATGLALLSQSPVAYAAPTPFKISSGVEKRQCMSMPCRIAEAPNSGNNTSSGSNQSSDSSASQLANVLVIALQNYLNSGSSSNTNTNSTSPAVDAAVPSSSPSPSPLAAPPTVEDTDALAGDAL
ncbi:hypothetical protein BJV74DRAFT_817770 [Russula compacta]|nr:hypothetical protein BJV74DRAFT_817770 [Russula compacta]